MAADADDTSAKDAPSNAIKTTPIPDLDTTKPSIPIISSRPRRPKP